MGNTLKFNSSVCTSIKQSQRLLDLGLKPETADMHYMAKTHWGDNWFIPKNERWYCLGLGYQDELRHRYNGTVEVIPAWSLHRLIEMCNKTQFGMTISIYNSEVTVDGDLFEVFDNTYDNLISVIELLIKRGHFKKEYLKQ